MSLEIINGCLAYREEQRDNPPTVAMLLGIFSQNSLVQMPPHHRMVWEGGVLRSN